jgi:hypothetical protein
MSEYANKVWEQQLGSKIVDTVRSEDWSYSYEMDAAHIFKLENSKYALITERGCSCYDYSDADIMVYETLEAAEANFPSKS